MIYTAVLTQVLLLLPIGTYDRKKWKKEVW